MSRPAPMTPSLPEFAQPVATLPESAWLQHRNVLHELYICQNKTLNNVKRIMEELHGFPIMRLHDYEIAVREVLRLRKNLTGQDWQAIKAHWDRRQDQGKKSNIMYNNMILDEKKGLRSMSRKRKRSHLFRPRPGTPALPHGVIIRTPPLSPAASIVTVVAPTKSCPYPGINVRDASNRLAWVPFVSPARSDGGIAFLEPTQVGLSMFQELRKECPFNIFFMKLQDLADSYRILDLVPFECAQAPTPRLLGINPSWELLARITFEISNNMRIDWTAHDSSWFLNWFGMSADIHVLRAFFSITGPTVCAVYENLCSTIHKLRRPAAANVLFELLDTIRGNNSIVADALNFLEIAVSIGSTSDGMLRIARRSIERHEEVLDSAVAHKRLWLSSLSAISERDTEILRLLVNAGARPNFEAEVDANSPHWIMESSFELQIKYQLLYWSLDQETAIDDFVQLLIEAGFLLTELPPRCYNSDRPEANLFPEPIHFAEAIILCPASRRQSLYNAIINHSGESQNFVRHAGIFTAAAGGTRRLEAYIRSCRDDKKFDILVAMQESLVFATLLNDVETLSALLQVGTDPSAGLLQSYEEEYKKGTLPWNPMVIASRAGSKEALMLLKEWSSLDSFRIFLELAPVDEIVRQVNFNTHETLWGRELPQLDEIRRNFLYESKVNGRSNSEIAIKIEDSRTNRLELLTWIRSNTVAHDTRTQVDVEILESAVSKTPECMQSGYHARTQNHYCDVLLLDGLVDSNLKYQESGMDLLQLSIRNHCSLDVVEFLLSKGFKVHSRPATETETETETQNTMLYDALLSTSPDRCQIVHLLLHQGADCKQTTTGLTILEASLIHLSKPRNGREDQQGYLHIFQCLLDKGAPVPQRPQRLVKFLIQAGAVDELIFRILGTVREAQIQGSSSQTTDFTWLPLAEAISQGRETLARELIRRVADVHVPANDSCDSTALQAACSSGISLDFIRYLILENGVDINEAPSENGGTSLQRCTSLSAAEFLLGHGADANALGGSRELLTERFNFRLRALDKAAAYGRLDMLKFLLKAGGRSGYGGLKGSIMLAKEYNHLAVLSVLLDWEREHRSNIVEEEAKWQVEHPDAAHLLSKPAQKFYFSAIVVMKFWDN